MRTATNTVVIIGAGMGGLAAAMRLAHAGLDVTLLERHAEPGGKMRCLPSAAGPVDAGPTVLTMPDVFEELFAAVGERFDDHVTLLADKVIARHWWPDGSRLDLFADPELNAAAITEYAGEQAANEFRRFSAEAAALFKAFDSTVMRAPEPDLSTLTRQVLRRPQLAFAMAPHLTLMKKLTRRFSDHRLRQLFGRYATYVGGSPYESPAVLALIWHAEASGVWSVQGGMHKLALAMAGIAQAKGAQIRYGADVTRIEIQGGRVAHAVLANGERFPCSHLVFNGDPAALERGQLGPTVRSAVPKSATSPRSLSANVWAFAARAEGPQLSHHNVFFAKDTLDEFAPISRGELPDDPTLYVCAQDRGAGALPDDMERFEIIMNAPPVRRDQTHEEIDQCRMRTFQTLRDRFGLSFTPEPKPAALTTPTGFDQLFPASDGSLYGRSPHGLMASFQRPTARTAIPGLYLAGGGAHPGAGVPMATRSGQHAAAAILRDRTSTSMYPPTAMPGGTSTGSAMTERRLSRSSPS